MKSLKSLNGNRYRLKATVGKFDQVAGFAGPQRIVALKEISLLDEDNQLFDLLWINCGKWSLILHENDKIAFDARINLQKKQKLERITKVSLFQKDFEIEPSLKLSDQERELIRKAINYGKTLWERTEGINSIILEIQNLARSGEEGIWDENHTNSLRALACKLVYAEWNTTNTNILSRLHEFIVWLKLMIDPNIQEVDKRLQKQFYYLCLEQWFSFYQGE